MSPKDLKKLADACRKAGIKSFKNSEVEFTLSDDFQLASRSKVSSPKNEPSEVRTSMESQEVSDEALLFWSAGTVPNDESVDN